MKNSLDGVCKILYCIYGMFLIYPIKTSEKQLITLENEVCKERINKNIFPYKLNFFVTIIFSIFILYITGDKSLLLPSLLMLITSGLIFYGRKLYYKVCEIDKLSNLNTKNNINSALWRLKVWHDKKETVEFKYRKVEIIVNLRL